MAYYPEVAYGAREEDNANEEPCDPWPGEECGRWSNGRLTKHCAKAGSEECEFECPYS